MPMKHLKLLTLLATVLIPASALAHLVYNPEHDKAIQNLGPIESATLNWQYQCGKFTLYINAYATKSALNGKAVVTGKITSPNESHNISKQLTRALTKADFLTGQMSIACNGKMGAFQIIVRPNEYTQHDSGPTIVHIFWDGEVNGIRTFNK